MLEKPHPGWGGASSFKIGVDKHNETDFYLGFVPLAYVCSDKLRRHRTAEPLYTFRIYTNTEPDHHCANRWRIS